MVQKALGQLGDHLLGMESGLECLERLGSLLTPSSKVVVHPIDEGLKLGMLVDGLFDVGFVDLEVEESLAVLLEQRLLKLGAHSPVAIEGLDVRFGDTALQVASDVLQVFGLLAVDVARQVQVEIVLFDFLKWYQPRVAR